MNLVSEKPCRALCTIIDSSALSVWREILREECQQRRLFWPSFADLSTAIEFKNAATRGDHFVAKKNPLTSTIKPLEVPPCDYNGLNIGEVWLVSGTRFSLNGSMVLAESQVNSYDGFGKISPDELAPSKRYPHGHVVAERIAGVFPAAEKQPDH